MAAIVKILSSAQIEQAARRLQGLWLSVEQRAS
jgi:hypothetical protein